MLNLISKVRKYMKVFLENFSKEETDKLLKAIKDIELVDTAEESDFWFNNKINVEDIVSIITNGDVVLPCDDDIRQRKA